MDSLQIKVLIVSGCVIVSGHRQEVKLILLELKQDGINSWGGVGPLQVPPYCVSVIVNKR